MTIRNSFILGIVAAIFLIAGLISFFYKAGLENPYREYGTWFITLGAFFGIIGIIILSRASKRLDRIEEEETKIPRNK
ncbi:MAG: hypothetical protein NTV30_05395 [Chloroflexi bacterium]|nr:hypothetical protein [Chloroflexota bacterium]